MVPQYVGISHVSYLLIDEHLNCFDLFMIVHNAAINIHTHVFLQHISNSLGKNLETELLAIWQPYV